MAEEGCERNNGGKANTRREERLFAKSWDVSTLVFLWIFRNVIAYLQEVVSVRPSVRPSVHPSVRPVLFSIDEKRLY